MKQIFKLLIILIGISNPVYSQWKKAQIPFGGTVKVLTTDKDGDIFAGMANGIYISSDNGNNWKSRGLEQYEITCLANSENYIFAGTKNDGVFYSTDKGENWTQSISLGAYKEIFSMIFKDNILFVGTHWGMFKTTDYGNTWIDVMNKIFTDYTAFYIRENNIFLATRSFMFLSTDDGVTWKKYGYVYQDNYINCIIEYNDFIYAGTYEHGVYRTTDNGYSWNQVKEGFKSKSILSFCINNGNLFSGTDDGMVYKWNEEQMKWDSVGNKFSSGKINTLISKDKILYAGTDNLGVFISEDNGLNWKEQNNGLNNTPVSKIAVDGNKVLISVANNVLYLSENNGSTWKDTIIAPGNKIKNLFIKDENIYTSNSSEFYFSKDMGKSWNQNNKGLNGKNIFQLSFSTNKFFASIPNSNRMELFSLDNPESEWKRNDNVFIKYSVFDSYKNCIALLSANDSLYLSLDTGKNWIPTNYKYGGDERNTVLVRDNYIFVSSIYGTILSFTNDYGNTWNKIELNSFENSVYSLVGNNSNLFVMSTDSNFYFLNTNTNNFIIYNEGLPNYITMQVLAISEEYIFACTNSGLYYLSINDLMKTDVAENKENTNSCIFPNPATDFITIQTSEVFKTSEVYNIQIFNIYGVEIITSPSAGSDILQQGNFRIDVSNLPAGVYYIRIGDKVEKFVKM